MNKKATVAMKSTYKSIWSKWQLSTLKETLVS